MEEEEVYQYWWVEGESTNRCKGYWVYMVSGNGKKTVLLEWLVKLSFSSLCELEQTLWWDYQDTVTEIGSSQLLHWKKWYSQVQPHPGKR